MSEKRVIDRMVDDYSHENFSKIPLGPFGNSPDTYIRHTRYMTLQHTTGKILGGT